MENMLNNANELIHTNPWLAFVAVFVGGLLTASNPCVLAMIPLTIGFVGGTKEIAGFRKAFSFSFVFVLGLAITFTILGIIAALAGRLLGDVGSYWKYIVAGVCFVMGIHLMELFRFQIPGVGAVRPKRGGIIGAFFLGLLFGVVSTPCAAPILVVLLAFIAAKGNVMYGALLLLVYALGHCVLILVAGTSVGLAKGLLEARGLRRATNLLRKGAGGLIILVGLYFLFMSP
ncbi:MAG: sulfite exporter TauE/SafE family protein [Gemmatimonadota bacterium]|nr:MAG: sulfite exporter TauE/SafE family protein [Gemmatimonadota bacterium]